MMLLIPLLPFVGFLINAFVGRRLPKTVSGGLACLAMVASFAVSVFLVWQLASLPGGTSIEATYYTWIASNDLQIPLQFRLDHLAALMILVVTGIGSLIHVYSTAYMHEESSSEYARYFSYLNLFASFMLVLVLGSTFPVLFVGWEGVGLCSYLLIGFWFRKKSAADAGKKAFVVNRIGDFGFILGMLLVFTTFGTLDFQQVAAAAAARAPETLAVVAAIGTATALMAGTIGLVQNDIKRVLAYSTVSQLGYMFLAMGVGAYAAGIFHLYTHAFFKALLFLGSGAVIHALAGEQDLRNMGGLKRALPITYWTFLTGAIAIAGVPPLAGFFSKDEILLNAYAHGHLVLWGIASVTAFLTATYMFRLVFLTFHGERRPSTAHTGHDGHGDHLHDAPPAMAFVLVVLAIGSVVAGFVGVPAALGGGNRIERFLHPSFVAEPVTGQPQWEAAHAAAPADTRAEEPPAGEQTELTLMALSTGLALAGIGLAAYFFLQRRDTAALARRFSGAYTLLANKYYVDEAYDAVIVQPIRQLSTFALWKGADAGIIDGAVNGVGSIVRGASGTLRRVQTGSVRTYAASLFVGAVMILGWYLWR